MTKLCAAFLVGGADGWAAKGTEVVQLEEGQPFFPRPGKLALGVTLQWVAVPNDLVARLDGKSSLGLLIHATAGLVDPGVDSRQSVRRRLLEHVSGRHGADAEPLSPRALARRAWLARLL